MYGLQGLGDHHVAVDGDGQQGDHGGDTKQGAAECIHLTAYRQTDKHLRQQQQDLDATLPKMLCMLYL